MQGEPGCIVGDLASAEEEFEGAGVVGVDRPADVPSG
jgi:hypothetical protein